MSIDPRYVTSLDLEPLLIDKDSSQPLAFGTISFFQDDNRTVPKLVYALSGAPPNYTYTPLPNPITLSANGTIMDTAGNHVALYYFPWDSSSPTAELQLYYVVVKNQFGTQQFTREAWPNYFGADSAASNGALRGNFTNLLSNPQFSNILFGPTQPLVITASGAGTSTTSIAADWDLVIISSGASTVSVTQRAIAGSAQYPTNPPYTLDFVASSNIISMTLRQRLINNPDIWSPATGGKNGYIATNLTISSGTNVTVLYAPSVATAGNPQTLLVANNVSGSYTQYSATVQLLPAANTDTAATGYVDILINLPPLGASSITSVQIVGLATNLTGIQYQEVPVKREQDLMFNYWSPLLQYKPIPSYLCGWDFPLNPAQQLGDSVAAIASGANTSNYMWDQTIVFQSANSGVSASRPASGALTITAATPTQFALIQYLDGIKAKQILNAPISVNVSSLVSHGNPTVATVSLWYCTDVTLPNMAANQSLVATLDANGHPATLNGNWVEVSRNGLGNAQFNITASTTTNFNENGFSGWDMKGVGVNSAIYFAIVVGTAVMTSANAIDFNSISVVAGKVPTRPAPQTVDEVLRECRYYWEKSYPVSTHVGVVGFLACKYNLAVMEENGGNTSVYPCSITFDYADTKRKVPNITFYSGYSGSPNAVSLNVLRNGLNPITTPGNPLEMSIAGNWTNDYITLDRATLLCMVTSTPQLNVNVPTNGDQAFILYNYVLDARLGIV